jgi:prepilin-type processing-associated H-X9-DG protein
LLVILAITVVLLALLLPAIGTARRQARTVLCLAHLRQLGIAFQIYCQENKGRAPQMPTPNAGGPLSVEPILVRDPRQSDTGVMYCPEAVDFGPSRNFGDYDFFLGTAQLAWGEVAAHPDRTEQFAARIKGSSYGVNWWAGRSPASAEIILDYPFISAKEAGSGDVPLFGDAVYPNAAPTTGDPVPKNLVGPGWNGINSQGIGTGIALFCIDRHKRAVNVVFLGGHARTVPLAELWKLKWSKTYVPSEVTLPRD